ncbi:MAG: DUF4105 domain-containing protein [Bacteroidales bacterium]|nr:DUF4105 domain-containing protein [Bacteroidales bacterium]
MRNIIVNVFLVAILLLNITQVKASQIKTGLTQNDTISVSLLTASQGKQIYERFGHTGIRIHIPSKKFDGVYHYGLFSFEEPHFEYRFVKGETDYMIGCMHYHDFLTMYAIRGSSVRELPLYLTQEEAHKLYEALLENMLPENQTYRYSFLYDNCATRPLNIIEKNLNGKMLLESEGAELPTYRDLIHECIKGDKWLTFGLDLILDGEADAQISLPDKPFLPHITEKIFKESTIERNGEMVKLAGEPKEVLKARESKNDGTIFNYITPNNFSISLFVIIVILSLMEIIIVRHFRLVDTIIFFICGMLGLVIYFLLLFSEHPAVSANINAMWLHPVWLVMLPFIWIRKAQKFLYCYHFINFAVLLLYSLFIIFIPQEINTATILLIAILLVRTITYIRVERSKNKKR